MTRHLVHVLVQVSGQISLWLTLNLRNFRVLEIFLPFLLASLVVTYRGKMVMSGELFSLFRSQNDKIIFRSRERFVESARCNHNTREGGAGRRECENAMWMRKRVFVACSSDKKNKCEHRFESSLRKFWIEMSFFWWNLSQWKFLIKNLEEQYCVVGSTVGFEIK